MSLEVANGLHVIAVMLENNEGGRFFFVEFGKLDRLDVLSFPKVGLCSCSKDVGRNTPC